MGLCGSSPEVAKPSSLNSSGDSINNEPASDPGIVTLTQSKLKKNGSHANARVSLKVALVPHVKIHRNQSIHDFYDISDEKLGEGMTGAVVKAKIKTSGEPVAIKNVRKNLVRDLKALLKEISLLAQCDHPNIVRIIGSAEDKHNVYMALEVCTGGALLDTLMNSQSHHFSESEVGRMAVMMFRAIEYCHANGIAHRDLKLDNWLFEKNNGELKLIDFGLSKKFYNGDYDHHGQLRMKQFLGTPGFVAPEMQQTHFNERTGYTTQVDVWSLGVIVFAVMSGRMPFKRKPSDCVPLEDKESRVYRRSFNKEPWPSISEPAKNFVEALLDPNPDERLTAAEALKHPFLIKHAKELKEKRMSMVGSKSKLKKQESQALTRITQFARTDALQKAAMLLIAHELHQDEIEKLRTIFYRLDSDDDGEITWREMKAGFLELDSTAPEDVHALFAAFTEHEEGEEDAMEDDEVIPYSYFLAATLDHHILCSTDRLKEAFHQFDPDDTGYVDLHQVMELLDDHGGRKHGPANVGTLKATLSQSSKLSSKSSGSGGSGGSSSKVDTRHVTFEEFVAAIEAFQAESKDDFENHMVERSKEENHRKKFVSKSSSSGSVSKGGVDSSGVAADVE